MFINGECFLTKDIVQVARFLTLSFLKKEFFNRGLMEDLFGFSRARARVEIEKDKLKDVEKEWWGLAL